MPELLDKEELKNRITELTSDPYGGYNLDQITPFMMVELTLEASRRMDTVQQNYRMAAHFEADCEENYREEIAEAWANLPVHLTHDKVSVRAKEAWVESATASYRAVRDHARVEAKAWFEAIRNARQVLSALQTAANMIKEDAGFTRQDPSI